MKGTSWIISNLLLCPRQSMGCLVWDQKLAQKIKKNKSDLVIVWFREFAAWDYREGCYLLSVVTGSLRFSNDLSYLAAVWSTVSAGPRVLFMGKIKINAHNLFTKKLNVSFQVCWFVLLPRAVSSFIDIDDKELLNLLLKHLLVFWDSGFVYSLCFNRNLANEDVACDVFPFVRLTHQTHTALQYWSFKVSDPSARFALCSAGLWQAGK